MISCEEYKYLGGGRLPSYSYSGVQSSDPKCRAHHAYLYSDGIDDKKAWCPPTAEAKPEYYLQIDLKNHYTLKAVITQALRDGQVNKYK